MMRKSRVLLPLAAVVAALPLAAPVAAIPTADLTTLAQYYPEDAFVFAATRADDAYIDTLDGLLEQVIASLPDNARRGIPSGFGLRNALDDLAGDVNSDGTFEDTVGAWLGDTVSIGVSNGEVITDDDFSNDDEVTYLIAAEITDRAAAEAVLAEVFPSGEITIEDDYLTGQFDTNGYLYISNDVLLLSSTPDVLPANLEGDTTSLATSEAFTQAFASLPATDYNIGMYLDLPFLVQSSFSQMNMMGGMDSSMEMLTDVYDAIGPFAVGLTILDETSLTIDTAISFDPALYETTLGIDAADVFDFAPVDFAFAQHLPAGLPLVIQGTDLNRSFTNALASFEAQMGMLEDMQQDMGGMDIQQALASIQFVVQGATGLDLEDEILAWMTGDWAIGLGFNAAAIGDSEVTSNPISFGIVIENTDGAGGQALAAGLARTLENFVTQGATVTTDTVGDVEVIEVTVDEDQTDFPFSFQVGANESVFVVGTPDVVESALNPDGGLAADPAYIAAQANALPNTPQFLYAAGAPLVDFLEAVVNNADMMAAPNPADADVLTALLKLIESATISGTYTADGVSQARAILTLP